MDLNPRGLLSALLPFTDDTRLLSLHLDPGIPASGSLLVRRLQGREAVSECGGFEVECYGLDAGIEAKQLLGRRLSVALNGAAGGERWFNGIVTKAAPREADGGRRRYVLTISPALALLGIPRSNWIYQELSVPDILDAELSRWQAKIADLQWRFDLVGEYPIRSYTASYAESPLAFIERLCAEEGIGYRIEHLPVSGTLVGQTRVIFFDRSDTLPANAQATTRFHRAAVTEAADTIDRWESESRFVPGEVTLASWEYKGAGTQSASEGTAFEHGAARQLVAALEDYAPQTQYYGSGTEDLRRYTRLRMEAFEAQAKTRFGESSVRSFIPGTATTITGHYDGLLGALTNALNGGSQDDSYLLLSVEHDARNNLPEEFLNASPLAKLSELAGAATEDTFEPGYRNRFTAIRQSVTWRPAFDHTNNAKPTAPSLQTALVVGASGNEIDVDELGRVLVCFHWDRNGTNTCRLRVSNAIAGSGWGMQTLPRVGQEVLIGFIEGDIDRPMVIGSVHNGAHQPPRFSHVGALPENRALSGYKSSELGGGRYNQWLADDTPGEISFKLQSEHAYSEVNLGYLTGARINGKATPRGEGAELRSDKMTAVRGAQGVLISAESQTKAGGAHLSRDTLSGQLDAAQALAGKASELAGTHQAGETDTKAQAELIQRVKDWEVGSNTSKGSPTGTAAQPMVAISGPAGVVVGSPESTTLATGHVLNLSSGLHTQLNAGRAIRLRALDGLSLFTQQSGIQQIAGKGKIQIQAQDGETELSAAKDVHIYSAGGHVLVEAPNTLTLRVGGAQLTLNASGVTIETSGSFNVKAASFNFGGGGNASVSLPDMPHSTLKTDEKFHLKFPNGEPMGNLKAEVKTASGEVLWSGRTDASGATGLATKNLPEAIHVAFLPD
ncbi:type VI secretion system Vgr family protein [Niveibacterium sp.]|uniref:type VI secretion system Vgr family protein n=1 Tax=Niveibacterium sp. TaxID=2017444 RepID=UPI0035B09342